jgi:outer membrane protein W
MNKKLALILALLLFHLAIHAQWEIRPGIGIANPITGYKTLTKSGVLYQLDVAKRLNNKRWAVGLTLGWARMHNDNNESDQFINTRLDQMPIVVTGEYELLTKKLVPYVGMGLGVSLYNFNYDVSPTEGETDFNASFSMMPRLGIRMQASEHWFPFLEVSAPLVMDGAPVGVDKADKLTGVVGVAIGAAYRF